MLITRLFYLYKQHEKMKLLDGKKITVGMRANVSLLSEIAVFTYNEEVKLIDIFKSIAL